MTENKKKKISKKSMKGKKDRKGRKGRKGKKGKKDKKDKKDKRLLGSLDSLLNDHIYFMLKMKNYMVLDSVAMNASIGTLYKESIYSGGLMFDTLEDDLNRNALQFSIKSKQNKAIGKENYIDYDLLFTISKNFTIGTYGTLSYNFCKMYDIKVNGFLKLDSIFNNDYHTYDLFCGLDINKYMDKICGGCKVSGIILGNSNLIDGINKNHNGISILPYANINIDNRYKKPRDSELFIGYEVLNKKIGNIDYDYDNFCVEIKLDKTKDMIF